MRRITECWHPENALLTINRRRDARLAARAIEATAAVSEDVRMQSFYRRRIPHASQRNTAADETLTFLQDEAGLVVEALASYTHGLEGHPFQTRRAQALIGALVIAAGPNVVSNPTQPIPYKVEA